MKLIRLSSQREVLQNLNAELNRLEQSCREKQNNLKTWDQAIVRHKQMARNYRPEMQQAESIVDELQDALDADAIEEGRLDVLKEHLAEAKEDVTTHEASYGDSIVAKDKNNESVRNTREQMAKIDKKIAEVEARLLKAENKASRCANDRHAALREKNEAIEAVDKTKEERDTLEKEREDQVKVVDNFIIQANETSDRVPVDEGENVDSLWKKFHKLEKDLAAAEKRLVELLTRADALSLT